MERKSGYYWVRQKVLIDNSVDTQWRIAFYYKETKDWSMIGSAVFLSDNNFLDIDECRIERNRV